MNKAVKVIIIVVSSIVSLAVILMIVFAILLNNFFSKLQEDKVSLTSPIVQLFISDDKKVELICKKTMLIHSFIKFIYIFIFFPIR